MYIYIKDEDCREKLRRRMERFLALANADRRPLLFVRGIAGSQELEHTEELFLALRERFEVPLHLVQNRQGNIIHYTGSVEYQYCIISNIGQY